MTVGPTMLARFRLGALLLPALLSPAMGQSGIPAEAAIRNALAEWTTQFNNADTREICRLFSPELRYDFRGLPERGYNDICTALRHFLTDPSKKHSYSFEIKEILVSGDLAVVRLVWTSKTLATGSTQHVVTIEPGMDVFRKDADGSWKIIRYIAYEE